MNFAQFRDLIIDDLNRTRQPYELDMESGFRNFHKETGKGGYLFSLPTVDRQYSYCPEDGWYYSGIASQGCGATLQEAIAQAQQEPANG